MQSLLLSRFSSIRDVMGYRYPRQWLVSVAPLDWSQPAVFSGSLSLLSLGFSGDLFGSLLLEAGSDRAAGHAPVVGPSGSRRQVVERSGLLEIVSPEQRVVELPWRL